MQVDDTDGEFVFQVSSFDVADAVPPGADALAGWHDRAGTPWIRAYGRTRDDRAVVAYIAGTDPYCYVEASAPGFGRDDLLALATWIRRAVQVTIKSVELVEDRASLFGAEPVRVVKVTLTQPARVPSVRSLWHRGDANAWREGMGTRVWEADVPFHDRFAIDMGAVPYCWLRVANAARHVLPTDRTETERTDVTVVVHRDHVRAEPPTGEWIVNAPVRGVGFDIECLGIDGAFPDATKGAPVILISAATLRDATGAWTESNVLDRVVFISGDGDVEPFEADRRARIERCASERAILLGFAAYLQRQRPDVITGYNTDNFDWPFVMERARQLGVVDTFASMTSRVRGVPMTCATSSFSSGARGHENYHSIVVAGATNVDMLRPIRAGASLRSYKLDAVARTYLGDDVGKQEMPYKEIPAHYAGTPAQRLKLCDYCLFDAELALRLMVKRKTVTNLISMARVTGIDMHRLITGGQGVKVHNQLVRTCLAHRLLVPTRYRPREEDDRSAGAVDADDDCALAAPSPAGSKRRADEMLMDGSRATAGGTRTTGKKKPGATRRKEKGYSGAIVIEPKRGFYRAPITTLDFSSLYPSIMIQHNLCYSTLVLPGAHCEHGHAVGSDEALLCCMSCTPERVWFWRVHVREGMLPLMLRRLLAARKVAKGDMGAAAAEEERLERVLAGLEPHEVAEGAALEAELAAVRSLHSVHDGMQLALKVSANSIYGFTGATVGKLPCLEISASVTGYGREMIQYIQALVTRKYRGAGLVNQEVSAIDLQTEVVYGDSVAGDTPLLFRRPDGSCVWADAAEMHHVMQGEYAPRAGDGKEEFAPAAGWCVWSSDGWAAVERAIRHGATGKRLLRVDTESGGVTVTAEHSLLRPDGSEVDARNVHVGDELMHRDLPAVCGDGPDAVGAASQHARTVHLATMRDGAPWCGSAIVNIRDVGVVRRGQYVYDLQTANHHFAAGAGRLVVHNTDSIMVNFGVERVVDAMELGKHAARLINAAFRVRALFPAQAEAFRAEHAPDAPDLEAALLADTDRLEPLINRTFTSSIGIVFEKVLWPYLLINKKRYAGGFYTGNPDKPDKVHQSGIESVRRDNALFTAETMGNVIKTLMYNRDPVLALMEARRAVRALTFGRVSLTHLTISKAFSRPEAGYANPDSQPHIIVNRRRREREPGTEYKLGDRIPYVMVMRPGVAVRPGRKVEQRKVVEDVDYARAQSLEPCLPYYIENQLRAPLTRIFDTIWGAGASARLLFEPDIVGRTSVARRHMDAGNSEARDAVEAALDAWVHRPRQSSITAFMATTGQGGAIDVDADDEHDDDDDEPGGGLAISATLAALALNE